MCFLFNISSYFKRRRRAEEQSSTNIENAQATNDRRRDGGGNNNYGFSDPPPRYDQIFKRGGQRPDVITTSQPPVIDSTIQPPSYDQISRAPINDSITAIHTRIEFDETSEIDHPRMITSTTTTSSSAFADMESELSNICQHSNQCLHRYSQNNANAVIINSIDNLTRAENENPPAYDTISIQNVSINI